jgi:hypothetical protein
VRLAGRSVEFRWECRVSPRCYHRIRLGRHVVTSSRQARGEVVRVVVRAVVRAGRACGSCVRPAAPRAAPCRAAPRAVGGVSGG